MKKGFTLVELLAVLVILGVITLVAVPSIIRTNEKSTERDYQEFTKTVENAAEIYMETHIDKKPSPGNYKAVTAQELKEKGFINSNLVNPNTKKSIKNDDYVIVTNNGEILTYEYRESAGG